MQSLERPIHPQGEVVTSETYTEKQLFDIPENTTGVDFKVDARGSLVVLTVGGKEYFMHIHGARRLASALQSQAQAAANSIKHAGK